MQKYKKLFGVLLSVLMVLSAVSVGLVAMAQEPAKTDAVIALEEKINAYNGNMDTKTPSEADLAGYNEIKADLKALSADEKESIDILTFDKFVQLVWSYNKQLYGSSLLGMVIANAASAEKADAEIMEVAGDMPSLQQAKAEMVNFYNAASSYSTKNTEDAIEVFNRLDTTMARVYVATYNNTYKQIFGKDLAYKEGSNEYYNDGFEAIVVLKYNDLKAEQSGADTNELVLEAIRYVADAIGTPEYAKIADYLELSAEAIEAYEADSNDYAKAEEALALYNSFSKDTQLTIRGLNSSTLRYEGKAPSAFYTEIYGMATHHLIGEYNEYMETVNEPWTMDIYNDVYARYTELPAQYLGELTDEAVSKTSDIIYYGFINTLVTDTAQPDVSGFQKTSVTYPSGASYDKVTNSLPKMNTLVQQIVSLVKGSDLQATINGMYTNATLGNIAATLFPMIESLTANPIQVAEGIDLQVKADVSLQAYRDDIADITAYNGALAHLDQLIASNQTWAALKENNFANGDFFVETGDVAKDKEAFLDAFATFFRPFDSIKVTVAGMITKSLFELVNFENLYKFDTLSYQPGIYENIATIFEAIGIDCIDSVTYSEGVYAAETEHEKMDARFRPILESVFDLLDTVGAEPVTTLLALLPNLANVLNTGLLNTEVQGILDNIVVNLDTLGSIVGPMLTLGGLGFDLSASGLFNTIGKLGIEGVTFTEGTDHAGDVNYPDQGTLTVTIEMTDASSGTKTPVTLTIQEADFIQFCKDMAGCGEMEVVESIQMDKKYTTTIVADQADAFVTLVRFVYDDVLMKNTAAVKDIINSMNAEVGSLLGPVIDVIQQVLPADAAIVALVTIADPLAGTGDIGGGLDDIGSIFDQIRDFFANLFNGGVDLGDVPIIGDIVDGIGGLFGGSDDTTSGDGTEQTGDPNIPAGGSVAGAVTSAIALAAGAAIVLGAVKVRRSREEDM